MSVTTIIRGERVGDRYIEMEDMKKLGIYLTIGGINNLCALRQVLFSYLKFQALHYLRYSNVPEELVQEGGR